MEILIFILISIVIGILVLHLSKPSFSEKKSHFMNMYSSLLSDMNQDYRDMRISPENLQNLASSIRILSREVHGMAKIVEKSHPAEQKWLLSMIDEFAQNIRLWIDRHATELSIEGGNIANSSIGEVPSVTLAKKRLDMQIEQFERAKILI